jgi:hypothetical protein
LHRGLVGELLRLFHSAIDECSDAQRIGWALILVSAVEQIHRELCTLGALGRRQRASRADASRIA